MKVVVSENFVQGVSGNCDIILSQRNLEMLQQYGAVHKGQFRVGSIEIGVQSNEMHYTEKQEKLHQAYTDPKLKQDA